jgi:hypothetical protein
MESRDYKVSIGRIGRRECDFIVRDADMNYAYVQVCMTIMNDKKTEDREFKPLEEIKDGYPKFTDNNTKAVFSWEVKVGLLDNDGNLITDVSLYNRPGRDAVESIWLKDTFSTLLSKDG